mgnify:CR=1 FL=1
MIERRQPDSLKLSKSRFAFSYNKPRSSPFLDSPPPSTFAYTEIVNDAQDIQNTYSSLVSLDLLSNPSAGGRDMYAMRINDDGVRPAMLIVQGIHGNEIDYAPGVHHWIREICSAATKKGETILDLMTIWWSVTMDPDGIDTDARENGNGVNLNRNFPNCVRWLTR